MSSGNVFERLFKLWATVCKLVVDGKRRAEDVVEVLQKIVDEPQPAEKFALFVDLGIITVPDDYDHTTQLAKFMKKNRRKFYSVNNNITDDNFPNPSRILRPGERLRVRAFEQVIGETTTSEERLAFLAAQNAVHTGAQGASLVFEQKRNQLPKDKSYASFDEKERLWEDAGGNHRVPLVNTHSGDAFDWLLGYSELVWDGGSTLLCFTEVKEEEVSKAT